MPQLGKFLASPHSAMSAFIDFPCFFDIFQQHLKAVLTAA